MKHIPYRQNPPFDFLKKLLGKRNTNLANAGMNPKALQYIMGHSNITMTLNYYAHATFASARAEMERLIAA